MSLQEKLILTSVQYDPSYNEGKGFKVVERPNPETRRNELCLQFKLATAIAETFENETIASHTTVTLAEDELKNRIKSLLRKENNGSKTPNFEIKALRALQEEKKVRKFNQAPAAAV